MTTRKISAAVARDSFVAIVAAMENADTIREAVKDADVRLAETWARNGDAAADYIVKRFGEGLPVAGKPAADSPESLAWPAILSDLGVALPDEDTTDEDRRAYDAARKRVQRVRWTVLLHRATGADWTECAKTARDFAHARTLVARGTEAVIVTPATDTTPEVRSLPAKARTPRIAGTTTDTTPVAGSPVAPTPLDVAVQTVAASTLRNVADTLHAVADKVRRADVIDPAIRQAMIADAEAILAALKVEATA